MFADQLGWLKRDQWHSASPISRVWARHGKLVLRRRGFRPTAQRLTMVDLCFLV